MKRFFLGIGFLKRFCFVLCHVVFLFFAAGLRGQSNNELNRVSDSLIYEDFENVYVEMTDDSLLHIQYENRRYRFEPVALAEVIEIVSETTGSDISRLHIVILYQKIPVLSVDLSLKKYRDYINGHAVMEEFAITCNFSSDVGLQTPKNASNNSQFKPDLVIIPNLRAQFGDFDNPVQSNINIIPELNVLLAKGLTASAQVIFPVQNDFFFDDEEKEIRPGNITVNQLLKLEDDFFITFSAGFFTLNRAGINIEFKKYFAERRFALGADLGYTGYHSFTGEDPVFYESSNNLTALLDLSYRYQPYDVTARIRGGYFLYNDLGARFDVLRQFGEVNIGFFAMISKDSEVNGGFNFAIPIPPRKYTKINPVRIRPAKKFTWEYRARGFPENGMMHETGHELFDTMLDFQPEFIKKRFLIILSKK